ncbi:MAG: hypothetical protein ACOX57_08835 [Limnochordia bacterium]|jgi:hypothetical protein
MLEGKNPHGNLWSSYTEYEQYQFLKEEFELEDAQDKPRQKQDGINEAQRKLTLFLRAIKDAEEKKDKPHLALYTVIGCSLLDLDRFITNYNEPTGSRCVGVWLREAGVIDVCRDYAVAVLDAHNFDVESTIRQLMRLGWLSVVDMADLAIVDGYGERDSFLRIYLDVAVSDTYNDRQVLTDGGSVDQ